MFGSAWPSPSPQGSVRKPNLHGRSLLGEHMGGGGAAPKMKMSDALILTGATILLGGLFMVAWVTPIEHLEESPPYVNGASMWAGDSFEIEITVQNTTTVRLVLKAEDGTIVSAESITITAGESDKRSLEIDDGGYYTYEIDTKGVEATLDLDIDRKYKIDMLPFPIGGLILAYGLYQRDGIPEEEDEDEILDAELDV